MADSNTKAEALKVEYERESCGRCGGSGSYSYNQIDGSRCYGCGGSGMRLTKRGRAAYDFMRQRLATDALSVKVGDRVRYSDALTGARSTFTIAEVREGRSIHGKSLNHNTGEWVHHETRSVTLVSVSGKEYGFGGAIPLERTPRASDIEVVSEYQDSLTKAGTPRKRRKGGWA